MQTTYLIQLQAPNHSQTNNADNALTSAWKDMRREPKSKHSGGRTGAINTGYRKSDESWRFIHYFRYHR